MKILLSVFLGATLVSLLALFGYLRAFGSPEDAAAVGHVLMVGLPFIPAYAILRGKPE